MSAETVYQAFGSKPALLEALVRRAARLGDEAPIPEQAGPRAVAAERDQRMQLQLFAADVVRRLERVGPLMAVVDAAAVSEPAIAELQRGIDRARRAGLAEFVAALSARGPLAVDRAVAVDTVWALASPDLQQLLMRRRGWSRTLHGVARGEPRPGFCCLDLGREQVEEPLVVVERPDQREVQPIVDDDLLGQPLDVLGRHRLDRLEQLLRLGQPVLEHLAAQPEHQQPARILELHSAAPSGSSCSGATRGTVCRHRAGILDDRRAAWSIRLVSTPACANRVPA